LKTVRGVKKYAKQFLKAVDLEEVPRAIGQLSAIADLMEKDKHFKTLMVSPVFTNDEKQKAIALIAQKLNMAEGTAKYLVYISNENVLSALTEMVKSIITLYLEMKKRVKAVVTSPVSISREYEQQLIQSLKQVTGRDIDLELVTDPSLLGGVRIKVGSTMYDSSIKGQLGLLRDKLIKG